MPIGIRPRPRLNSNSIRINTKCAYYSGVTYRTKSSKVKQNITSNFYTSSIKKRTPSRHIIKGLEEAVREHDRLKRKWEQEEKEIFSKV